jgi:uroporphyrin-III C-methyltransferase
LKENAPLFFLSGVYQMSTETEVETVVTQPPPEPKTVQPKTKKHRFLWFFLFLILLLGGTIILGYPLGQRFEQSQKALQEEVNLLNTQVEALETALQAAQSEDIHTPLNRLQALFNTLSEKQQELDTQVTYLVRQLEQQPHNNEEWKLAEIQYLLKIALQRLQLAYDPESALAALKAADQRLQYLNKPTLFQLRTQLLEDIKRLEAIERPDTEGLVVSLSQSIAQADQLPLLKAHDEQAETAIEESESSETLSWQAQWWEKLKEFIVIRYNTEAEKGFLNPGQKALVVQILHLRLENVRFFLLRHDTQNFSASITAVLDWLKRYYDQNDKSVQSLQKDLRGMQKTDLNPPLPDISGSFTLLQNMLAEKFETASIPAPSTSPSTSPSTQATHGANQGENATQ